jgi:hypothetical protein
VEEATEEMVSVPTGCAAPSGAGVELLLSTAAAEEDRFHQLEVLRLVAGPVVEATGEMGSVPMACVAPSGDIVELLLPTADRLQAPRLAVLPRAVYRLVVLLLVVPRLVGVQLLT